MAATTRTKQQTVVPVTPVSPITPTSFISPITPISTPLRGSSEYSPASQESDSDDDPIIRNIRTEADVESAIRTAQLHGVPEYNPLAPTMNRCDPPKGVSKKRGTPKTRGRQLRPRPKVTQRLQETSPGRRTRVNCRMKVPGTDMTHYVCGGKTYYCPPHITPWEPEQRWMLRPRHNVFMPSDSRDPKVKKVYHYHTNSVFSPSRKDNSSMYRKWRENQDP